MSGLLDATAPFVQIAATAASAGILALLLTPLVERLAGQGGWTDAPSEARWHDAPTPHLGGIALFASVALALAVSGGLAAFSLPVWMGALLLFCTGLADDLWGLRPGAKLAAQLASAGLVVGAGVLFWPAASEWVAVPLTVLWVLGLTNALNLLDAMDGVAAGVAAVAAGAFGVIAGLQGHTALAAVAAALAASEGGFLVFNASPARIFMGDCGSLPLGFLLAVLGLGVQGPEAAGASPSVSILVLGVPLFDTVFVSVTRLRRGQSVAEGGVDHTMHRLVRLGWSERRVAAVLWGAGALCGASAVLASLGPPLLGYGISLVVGGTAVGSGLLLARRTEPEPSASASSDSNPAPVSHHRSSSEGSSSQPPTP